jgi:WD40 repeat protein
MEVFNADGQRVGVYPYYDLYGYQFDNMNGFVSPFHWSKDGRYLFIAAKGAGDGGPTLGLDYEGTLIRVNLKNGTWEDTGISGTMSFSPTDQYIAYSAANNSEIRIMDLKSGTETKFFVTDYYRYFSKFVWSPSGRKIIVAALPEDWFEAIFPEARIKTEGIVSGLYVIDLDLKTIYKVHESAYPFYYPVCWSEDNKITLDRMNEHGEWTLDLSTNPPTITP